LQEVAEPLSAYRGATLTSRALADPVVRWVTWSLWSSLSSPASRPLQLDQHLQQLLGAPGRPHHLIELLSTAPADATTEAGPACGASNGNVVMTTPNQAAPTISEAESLATQGIPPSDGVSLESDHAAEAHCSSAG
jgi:hypothetical protein